MKYCKYIALLWISTMWIGCSTQKNTWASRSFHEMKTEYNIYFNGMVSFEEGLDAIRKANEDNYSTILTLYPVSNHQAAQAASSQMDKTIEKCRKCIKLHSIKSRPKIDPKKKSDPEYQLWLKQEEFNSKMCEAWLLLGEAEFHKGDFLGSISTFNYVIRHYQYNREMVARCQLWVARAYGELGWLYEAEEVLGKVAVDDLSRKNAPLYSAVSADLNMKLQQYREAIPYIKIAKGAERKKGERPRFEYVLGQLYEMNGQNEQALNAFTKVIRLHPSTVMDFNARIHRAKLQPETKKALKEITRMAKLDKYKDNLDQLYGVIGDIYLEKHDTINALKYYEEAIAKSTQKGNNKAYVLVTAGDIYYGRCDYVHAAPCYNEAVQILTAEYPRFIELQKRSEALDELVKQVTQVQLQDSLQRLAQLSETEQLAIVDELIAKLIKEEEEAKEKEEQAERAKQNDSGSRSVNTTNMFGGGGSTDWYFYNPQLIRNGKQAFRTQWGTRHLEDDWRRMSKTTSSVMEIETDTSITMMATDTIADKQQPDHQDELTQQTETDAHKPEYYLQQIPKTNADFTRSNQQIADALYQMVYIYRDKLEDMDMSNATFAEFCRRFPNDERLVEIYYLQYLTALKENNQEQAERLKEDILKLFPQTEEAKIVAQPDYFVRLQRMALEQDSVYEDTYFAYQKGNYTHVIEQKLYAQEMYPLSPLMPRFLFLNAIALAKTKGQNAFVEALQQMVELYPESELSAMSKDMLAMMGQGAETQKGGSMASLQDKRQEMETEQMEVDTTLDWNPERHLSAKVILILKENEENLNKLLYEVALFNFSQFMIKDFDLKQQPLFLLNQSALMISGMESLDEAEWYQGMLEKNAELMAVMAQMGVQIICITEENAALLGKRFSVDEYVSWLQKMEKRKP